MSPRGWTLHEMLISLAIMGVVAALASHVAVAQLRFFAGVGEIVSVRSQASEVGAIVASELWDVSPADGDVLLATDTALEVRTVTGVSVVCDATIARLTFAEPSPTGNTLAWFARLPVAGDVATVLAADSIGGSFTVTLAGPPAAGACPAFGPRAGLVVPIVEPVVVPPGSMLRFVEPVRFSLYRASDSRWYFGVRDWNRSSARLNTVQPVAGPLKATGGSGPGLRFRYFARDGTELVSPADVASLARVSVTVRAESRRPVRMDALAADPSMVFVDSLVAVIAFRNAR